MVWFNVNVLQPSMVQNTRMKMYLFRDHFELLCTEQSPTFIGHCGWQEINGIHVETNRSIITIDRSKRSSSKSKNHDRYRIQFAIANEMRQFLDFVCIICPRMICHYHSNRSDTLQYIVCA